MKRGHFITIEGSEGAGKSTNLSHLCAQLTDLGIAFYQTREPGGTPLAEEIRQLLLTPRQEVVNPTAELLMMFAARAQHIQEEIRPRLEAGQWVVCDRFTDATYAYQGYARGLPLEQIEHLEQWVQDDLHPDLTLFLDVPPEIGAERIQGRDQDRMEQEAQTFFELVRAGYLARAGASERFRVIDAGLGLPEVIEQVRNTVIEYVTKTREVEQVH